MAENVSTMDSKQYIVVELGNEQYGIDIQYIDNIVRMQRITRVPKAQHFFKGVINLRGEVIPVMSLRLKFDFEEEEYTNKTRILIVKPDAQASVGIIVDAVKEVLTISNDMIDKVARDIIVEYGYGDYFIHSTGHSLGLDIHETPGFSVRDDTIIEKGMVLTIEPGIYLEGKFGVRLEDTVSIDRKAHVIGDLPLL